MNIAFFGTSDRSVPLLEALKKSEFDLVLCVTKEDTVVGRKRKIRSTAVKEWSKANRVQCVTTLKLNSQSTAQITNQLLGQNIQLCVVADFSFMIPANLLEVPKHGFVNIHFSLLPSYRGASPVQFAILNGDKTAGITYMITTKGLDDGPIVYQIPHPLIGTETSGELYAKLFEIAAQELPSVLQKYVSGELVPKEQDHTKATYTYSPSHPKRTFIFKEDAKLDWVKSVPTLERMVRAYNPWPIAWTTLGDLNAHHSAIKPGKNPDLKVKIFETGVENNALVIKRLQVEGKSAQSWKDFENGYVEKSKP